MPFGESQPASRQPEQPSAEEQLKKLEGDLEVIKNNIAELSQQESQAALKAIQGYQYNATMIEGRIKALRNKNRYQI